MSISSAKVSKAQNVVTKALNLSKNKFLSNLNLNGGPCSIPTLLIVMEHQLRHLLPKLGYSISASQRTSIHTPPLKVLPGPTFPCPENRTRKKKYGVNLFT